jgi:outer membrane protein assembly factor BamB
MPPDPLYVATVAETVRSSVRNTDDPAEIRRYLYELRDAVYEAKFDGDLAAELRDDLEEDIETLNDESLGPVDESRKARIVDHVHRVERFCQRRGNDGSDTGSGDGSAGTSQDITINFGVSSDESSQNDTGGSSELSEWPPEDASAPEPIVENPDDGSTGSSSDHDEWTQPFIEEEHWNLTYPNQFGRTSPLDESSWPTYRGGLERQGTDSDFGTFTTPTVDWETYIGGSPLGEPVVVADRLVVPTKEEGLVFLDSNTGAETGRFDPGASCYTSPAVCDGTVYCGFDDGGLYAIDRWGNEQWRHLTFEWVRTVPIVVDDVVFFGDSNGTFYALDAHSGRVHGSFTHESNGIGSTFRVSPAVHDGVLVAGTSHTALGIDYESGVTEWTRDIRVDQNNAAKAPAVADGTVYYPGKRTVYALDPMTGSSDWECRLPNDGQIRSAVASDGRFANDIGRDGSVYVTMWTRSNGTQLYRIDGSGTIESSVTIGDSGPTSPIATPSAAIVGTMEGAIERYEDSLFPEWSLEPADDWTRAAPIVADGTLYASFGRTMYAYS